MKKALLTSIFILSSCTTPIVVPSSFEYKEIKTQYFTLASWQKVTTNGDMKIYIEGDGSSFNSRGYPTSDPTPRGTFLRKKAFEDDAPNVIYLARPCQFVNDFKCKQVYWTTGRFAPEVIVSTADAIKKIAKDKNVELIGFSGGSQVAGLVSVMHPEIHVQKIVNYAPNLDHVAWTDEKNLYPLSDSLSLTNYQDKYLSFNQINYIAEEDSVIPMNVTINFLKNDPSKYRIIENVGHNFR